MSEEKKRYISLRNKKIIVGWARHGISISELAGKYNLTVRRINQIVNDGHSFIKVHKEREKAKRINIVNRLIEHKQEFTNKDIIDLLEYQRKEIDGDDKQHSAGETKIIIIRSSEQPKDTQENTSVIERTLNI